MLCICCCTWAFVICSQKNDNRNLKFDQTMRFTNVCFLPIYCSIILHANTFAFHTICFFRASKIPSWRTHQKQHWVKALCVWVCFWESGGVSHYSHLSHLYQHLPLQKRRQRKTIWWDSINTFHSKTLLHHESSISTSVAGSLPVANSSPPRLKPLFVRLQFH